MKKYSSIEEFAADLPEIALKVRNKLQGMDETFCVHVIGKEKLYVSLQDGLVRVLRDEDREPVCTLNTPEQTLLDLIAGKVGPIKALMFGGVRVHGNKNELLRLIAALTQG